MAIGHWVSVWDGHTLTYTDGITTISAAAYEALYPTVTVGPTPPPDPEVNDYWVDTSP